MKFFLLGVFLILSCQNNVYEKIAPNINYEVYERALKKVNFIEKVPADILFVIDNSGSMSSYQESLKKNFRKMINRIHSDPYLDYRIGVINSSPEDSGHFLTARGSGYSKKDRPFVTKEDLVKGGSGSFTDLVNRMIVGTSGSGTELFYYPLVRIIEEETKLGDLSFFREDAFLVIIIMTDEDESRVGISYRPTHLTDQELISSIYSVKRDLSKIISFSITSGFIPESQTEESMKKYAGCFSDKGEGDTIRDLITQLKGDNYSLCTNFTKSLDSIGKIIKKRMHLFVPLNRVPIIESIKVFINEQLIPNNRKKGWYYDLEDVGIHISPGIKIDGESVEELGDLDLVIDFIPAKGD